MTASINSGVGNSSAFTMPKIDFGKKDADTMSRMQNFFSPDTKGAIGVISAIPGGKSSLIG